MRTGFDVALPPHTHTHTHHIQQCDCVAPNHNNIIINVTGKCTIHLLNVQNIYEYNMPMCIMLLCTVHQCIPMSVNRWWWDNHRCRQSSQRFIFRADEIDFHSSCNNIVEYAIALCNIVFTPHDQTNPFENIESLLGQQNKSAHAYPTMCAVVVVDVQCTSFATPIHGRCKNPWRVKCNAFHGFCFGHRCLKWPPCPSRPNANNNNIMVTVHSGISVHFGVCVCLCTPLHTCRGMRFACANSPSS